jgi:hypothetical protein
MRKLPMARQSAARFTLTPAPPVSQDPATDAPLPDWAAVALAIALFGLAAATRRYPRRYPLR